MNKVFNNHSYVGGLTRAFSIDGRLGNPSFVLMSENSENIEMKIIFEIASRYNCEVTWAEWQSDASIFKLRYFKANEEIDFCGHGTLATAAWLSKFQSTASPMEFRVLGGSLIVDRSGSNGWFYRQAAFSLIELFNSDYRIRILESLGLADVLSSDMHKIKFFCTEGATREKVIVKFPNEQFLQMIQINASIRDELCCSLESTGLYVFVDKSNENNCRILARHFPIYSAEQEDIATGAIASTVAKYIWKNGKSRSIDIFQGGSHTNIAHILVSKDAHSDSWHVGGECCATESIRIPNANPIQF